MSDKKISVRWIFLCCWFTYLTAYLCRVNFSSAMNALTLERGLSAEHLGIVGAVFYGIYACGQLVNGYIGDRVRANRYMLLALFGTMLCNTFMSFASTFPAMLIFWGLNGCFQSMFWSTIIRVLAQNITAAKRAIYSVGISLTMPPAYILSWGLLGKCLAGSSAKWYFLIPVFACILMIAAWLFVSNKGDFSISESRKNTSGVIDTIRFLFTEKLHWMIGVCLLHGLIKEGVAYWTPLLISRMDNVGSMSPFLLACILPFANMLGILASRVLMKKAPNPFMTLIGVFAGIALISVGLIFSSAALALIGLMAFISGLTYANNTILMSFIPMQYTERNMVASIIGVFDFSSYAGAAVSTYVLGKVLESAGFSPLPGIWLGAAVTAMLLACVVVIKRRKGINA